MADKPIKVRVAGYGQMGSSHAKAYHAMPGFEIVGVVSRGAASSPTTTVSAAWSRRCFSTRSGTAATSATQDDAVNSLRIVLPAGEAFKTGRTIELA